MTVICQYMTNIQNLSLSWILMFLVQELLYLVHACSSCPILFPDAVVTGICWQLAHPALLFFRLHRAGPPECGTFVAPKRHARSSTNGFILSTAYRPFPLPPPLIRGGGGFRGRGRVFRGRGGGRRRRVGVVGVERVVACFVVVAAAAAGGGSRRRRRRRRRRRHLHRWWWRCRRS